MSQQHAGSVWKLDRIMVAVRSLRIDRTEFADPNIDCSRPDPSIVVFNILLEGELGSWKQANRYRRITFGSEAAGRRARKCRSDKRLSNFGGARC
jgi:hypothetical protein